MTEITAKTDDRSRLRVILAASIGSALEWYDFFLYGTAAALVFGELFFPKSDPVVGTLLAFLTFGVGFVVRPLGGILFGIMGDRFGRKPVLVATLLMIGVGTTLIGLLPTYAQIGYWAPALLVAMRVVQGLGAGAEYGGAVIFLVENAPPKHRGFWGSFAPLGVSVGNLLAAGAFALVTLLAARRPDVVGLAPAVPGKLPADHGRHLRSPEDYGDAGVHRGRGRARQDRAQPGDGSAEAASAKLLRGAGRAAGRKRSRLSLPGVRPQLCHYHAGRAEGRRAECADARLRHRAVHHHGLCRALRPHRTTAGLYVRRTRRHRMGVPVLPAWSAPRSGSGSRSPSSARAPW